MGSRNVHVHVILSDLFHSVVGARAREVALAPDVVLLHPVVFVAALGHGRAPGRAPGLVPGAVTASMWTLSPVLWEVL